jgi:hypothetical protein
VSLRWSEAFSRDSVPKAQRRIDELAMGGVPHLRCRHPRGVDRSLEELRVRETLCRSGSCRSFTPVSLNNRLHRAGSTAAEAVGTTASCAEWDIAGKWLSVATNNYDVTLIVAQHGTHLSGRAPIPAAEAVNSHYSDRNPIGEPLAMRVGVGGWWSMPPRTRPVISSRAHYEVD